MTNKTKTCNGCKQELSLESFSKRLNGHQHLCKPCQSVYQKNYVRRKDPKARAIANRKWRLLKEFGITIDQYVAMLIQQNQVCAVCEQPEKLVHHATKQISPLSVDHCHKTGKVRALLCNRCNTTLGKVADDPNLLDKLSAYLRSHSDTVS
jgi:hypothetical protein